MATNIRRVDGGIAPCAFPSAQPSLHTTRALDSRCDENDGVGLPDSHCGSNNGYQVTSSYLPLHGPERGHRNADNEKTLRRRAKLPAWGRGFTDYLLELRPDLAKRQRLGLLTGDFFTAMRANGYSGPVPALDLLEEG